MGRDDILNEVVDIKKRINEIDAKMDRVLKKILELESKFKEIEKLEESMSALPAKLNTTSFQVISQFKDEIGDIEDEFEERIDNTMGKLESLANMNIRLTQFEQTMKAYMDKMRYMLLELEDEIKEGRYENGQ